MPRARQRTPELRAELLAAALTVLAERGHAGLTTRAVATRADTSVPALYELFGDKSGLVRKLFFEGFRLQQAHYDAIERTHDPAADLYAVIAAFRSFATANPRLFEVMYAIPFAEFRPGPAEAAVGASTRRALVGAVERCVEAGDVTDIAHGLPALAGGLATQEIAGWLGSTPASIERRWDAAVRAHLRGLGPGG